MNASNSILRPLLALVALSTLSACSPPPADRTVFKYDFTEATSTRTCQTTRTYGIKEQFCQALNDEQLNGGCAFEQRKQLFAESGCNGTFNAKIQVDLDVTAGASQSQSVVSYEFISVVNGVRCTTGVQTAASLADTCFSVLDDAKNGNCARDQREEYFRLNCD